MTPVDGDGLSDSRTELFRCGSRQEKTHTQTAEGDMGRIQVREMGYSPPEKGRDPIAAAVLGGGGGTGKEAASTTVAQSWSEFTQNTTFHGVKYMFEETPLKTRRIAWTICVTCAIAFFVGQISYRIAEYFKYKTNISMKVVYNDSVPFPALTLCNQNKFRIGVANDYGAYHYLNDYYSMDQGEDGSKYKDHVKYLNTSEFFKNSAHEYQDLFDTCNWNRGRCNDSDFRRVLTDEGICYTFNFNGEKRVTESGSTHALSLILNVEQYHHMRGPQKDAGVKMLLHNPNDPPEMKDLGFVAAPGFHTLVAIQHATLMNLPAPHGTCLPEADSMAVCKHKCKAQQFVSTCGCQDIYMDDLLSLPRRTCSVPELFNCQNQQVTNETEQKKQCECATKCERSSYRATLSSALLSKFNIDTMALMNATKRTRATKQFKEAMEVSARLVPEYEEEVKPMMRSILNTYTEIETVLEDAVARLTSPWADILRNADTMLTHTELEVIPEVNRPYYTTNQELLGYQETVNTVVRLVGMDKAENWLADMTDSCRGNGDVDDYLTSGACPSCNPPPGADDGDDCTEDLGLEAPPVCPVKDDKGPGAHSIDCLCYLTRNAIQGEFSNLTVFITTYNNTVTSLFAADPEKLNTVPYHSQCLELLSNAERDLITPYTSLQPLLASFQGSGNSGEWADRAVTLQAAADNTPLLNYTSLATNCWWFKIYAPEEELIEKKESDEYKQAEQLQEAEEEIYMSATWEAYHNGEYLREVKEQYTTLTSAYKGIKHKVKNRLSPAMDVLRNYLSETDTRLNLANNFTTMGVLKAVRDIEDLVDTSTEALSTLTYSLKQGLQGMKNVWMTYDKLTIPFLTEAAFQNLTLVNMARNLSEDAINSTIYMSDVSPIKKLTGVTGSYDGLIDHLASVYVVPLKEMEQIEELCVTFIDKASEMREILTAFVDSLKMDSTFFLENFLQVDVFYEELKYSETEEQEAFPLLSLMGEIGGFMGLLLGASLITVCEVMDYILMKIVIKHHQRKARKLEAATCHGKF